MPTRCVCIALWLALAATGCHAPGHGPAWDALVELGRLSGEVRSHDGLGIAFEAGVPAPGDVGAGPMLVLVHGWCGDRGVWGPLDGELWSRRNVVSLDLAGHGASDAGRADASLGGFARDVVRLVDHLGLTDAIVVGHGMGAQVALEAAALRPQALRGVVAVEAFHDLSQSFTVAQATMMEKAFASDLRGTMALYVERLVGPGAAPGLAAELARTMSATPIETALNTLQAAFVHDLRAALVTLPVPLVQVNGDQRPTHSAALHALVPHAGAEIVAGSGYFPQLEQPERFGQALDRALALIEAFGEARS